MTTKFDVRGRYSLEVQFTAEIGCGEGADESHRLGLAVLWARHTGADLSGANLSGADLSGANLREADLREAYLREAYLRGADLRGADLRGADLSRAYLSRAYLIRADLSGANLRGANLRGANLSGADLSEADLRGADLREAYLREAYLSRADLRGADLREADLREADLSEAKNAELAEALTVIVPEGVLIGWKKCVGGVIIKLEIPADAKRSNATGRKCRAEFAKVLDTGGLREAVSVWDASFIYRVGEIVRPTEPFCEDRWQECAAGIHFFITEAEARAFEM